MTQSHDGSVGHTIRASVSPECCQPVAPAEILLASVALNRKELAGPDVHLLQRLLNSHARRGD